MSIISGFEWLLSGGGAGIVAYMAVNRIRGLAELASQTKRIVAFAISGGLGVIAWAALIWLAQGPWPATPQAWVTALFAAAATAIATSTGIHTRDLPKPS